MDVAEDPSDDSLMSFHHPSPVDITEAGHHTRQVSSTLSSAKQCYIDGNHHVYQRLRVPCTQSGTSKERTFLHMSMRIEALISVQ
eukprot:scaffold14510_cov215-Skeletonema_marinoi.AAC.1